MVGVSKEDNDKGGGGSLSTLACSSSLRNLSSMEDKKGKEPDVSEFISALAEDNNAQLMVMACAGAPGANAQALVAARHQTDVILILITLFRKYKNSFDGQQVLDLPPEPLSGEQIYEIVQHINIRFGKPNKEKKETTKQGKGKRKKNDKEKGKHKRKKKDEGKGIDNELNSSCWKKKSIFFDLEYWKTLLVRHNLDVMHIEKNVCDSIVGTLLNIPGKTKDTLAGRLDLKEMGVKSELHPTVSEKRTYLPPACFTLSKDEKRKFCETLANIKVPDGYSSNISNLVSIKDFRLIGLKSHDCHALMQQLLPIAMRSVSQKHVRYAVTRMCFFFNAVCAKTVDPSKLDKLQDEIGKTLCMFEKYFPPTFFDIMIHLTVHLVREVKLCGPVYLRWMYPFERYMKILKGYVRNRYRPEASIVESYIAEESVEFCSEYIANVDTIGIPKPRRDPKEESKGIFSGRFENVEVKDLELAHRNVLENTIGVQPYIKEHLAWLTQQYSSRTEKWIRNEHHKTFKSWFQAKVHLDMKDPSKNVSENLIWISEGPSHMVVKHDGYIINGHRFNTKELDGKRVTQNSGVSITASVAQFSTAKDKNHVYSDMTFYGLIDEIWELNYHSFKVPVFKCDWVESNNGVKVDELSFTLVNLNRLGHKSEPFILGTQAKQVFYVEDPLNSAWSIVLSTQPRNFSQEDQCDDECLDELNNFTEELADIVNFDDAEATTGSYARQDVDGVWVDKVI
uniref:Transposase n=1 Tax=Cannabis sativa TaxID=3483 RepID=A0A803PCS7_CANSA